MNNKKLLSVCVASAFITLPAHAQGPSDKLKVSGFADIIYVLTDDATSNNAAGKSPTEGKFGANAEVDFQSQLSDTVSVRLDADVVLAANGGTSLAGDSGRIEQVYFAWTGAPNLTLLGGVFNNPIGWEKEDAPDLYQVTHGQIWDIMNGQTALDGNNVAGVAGAYNFGMGTVTVALLNEVQQTDEENSFAFALNLTPIDNLDVEFGYVTEADRQDSTTATYGSQGAVVGSAENWWDLNATYKWEKLTLGAEVLVADQIVDMAYMLIGNYSFDQGIGVTVRYDSASYQDTTVAPILTNLKDTETLTLAASYQLASNLTTLIEYRMQDDANDTTDGPGGGVIADGDLVQLEFVATF